jgi:hypothetical protein
MTSKTNLSLADFEAGLSAEEAEAFAQIKTRLGAPDADTKAIRDQFFAWATPIVSRLGGDHPGTLWPQIERQFAPRQRKAEVRPLTDLAERLPYPLGFKVRELLHARRRRDEGESEPQYPFELCAVMGVLVRLAALITIRAFVDAKKSNPQLNHLIVSKLRAPSDGGWLEIAQRLSSELEGSGQPIAELVDRALKDKGKKGSKALSALVKFRNDLLHGETISEKQLNEAGQQLELAIRAFATLGDYRLEVRHAGQTWSLNGAVPRPIEDDDTLPEDEPCLAHREDLHPSMSLSPLLRFRAGEGEADMDVDFDELFFLNAGSLERLSYIGYRAAGQLDGKTLGSYEAFKAFIAEIPTPPIPKDPCIDFSGLAEFHARLFVGRGEVLEELSTIVAERSSQYAVMKALAGMGKSAIFATLLQAVRNRTLEEAQQTPNVADGLVRAQDLWAFHFCMPTDGRNSPTVALRSLIAQICDHFEIKRKSWLSHDLDELKDEKFPALLAQVSGKLEEDQRLVVVIDALDEGIGAEKETVPSCIPAGDYPGVVFLLSYRVDTDGNKSRVEKQLSHLAADRLPVLGAADPLKGLTQDDVHRFLDKVDAIQSEDEKVTPRTREVVWAASTRDADADAPAADPFYLRFVADGVQAGTIRLARAETVPESLDEAFEEMWMGLPGDQDFLCHRVLLTLGIMREYGDDELFSALFNRERPADDRLAPNDVAAVRVKAGKLLVYDGDRYGLFHDRFRVFLVGEQKDPIAEALGMG